MAQKKGFKISGVFIAAILLALPVTIFLVGEQTKWYNQASGPDEHAFVNLNRANEIETTNNPDGTMGPPSWIYNFAQNLPATQKGNLAFSVSADPQATGTPTSKVNQGKKPTKSPKQGTGANQATSSANKNGPQTVTALNLTISKVEVHLVSPGNQQSTTPNPSTTPGAGNSTSRWETLNVANPTTLDLVQLATTGNFSSLGITTLAAGKYTEIRLYVTSANATLEDGTSVTLTIPGKNSVVRIVRPFTVIAGQTTNLKMDFDAQRSVIKTGKSYMLRPVVGRLLEN